MYGDDPQVFVKIARYRLSSFSPAPFFFAITVSELLVAPLIVDQLPPLLVLTCH